MRILGLLSLDPDLTFGAAQPMCSVRSRSFLVQQETRNTDRHSLNFQIKPLQIQAPPAGCTGASSAGSYIHSYPLFNQKKQLFDVKTSFNLDLIPGSFGVP